VESSDTTNAPAAASRLGTWRMMARMLFPDWLGWAVLIGGALFGSVVGGVAGFGAGVILLPLVAWALGIRAAAPVLTVTMLLGNLARIWWSRGPDAVPATAVGAALYAGAASDSLRWIMGGFLIAAVPCAGCC